MFLEFCAEELNFIEVFENVERKFSRIELCEDLSCGGITPNDECINKASEYCQKNNLEMAVMVRPNRQGHLLNKEQEEQLLSSISSISNIPNAQLVFGCLDEKGMPNINLLEKCNKANTGNKKTVFHMAFDEAVSKNPYKHRDIVNQIIDLGFSRILTHGNIDSKSDIMDNLECLDKTKDYSNEEIEIMAGGGLDFEKAKRLESFLKLDAYHGTKIVY